MPIAVIGVDPAGDVFHLHAARAVGVRCGEGRMIELVPYKSTSILRM
jgi:hypothetical protein